MRVVVGRIGRAHGLRGEVGVEVRTDAPEARFAVGATLHGGARPLRIAASRWHGDRLLVGFDGVADRTAAESLRGLLLEADVDPAETPDEPDTYYDRHLVGLTVVGPDGTRFGVVREVVHLPGHDLLAVVPAGTPAAGTPGAGSPAAGSPAAAEHAAAAVSRAPGRDAEVLVPFVAAIVPDVDLGAGLLVVTPPPGLFPEPAAVVDPDDGDAADVNPDDGDSGEPSAGS